MPVKILPAKCMSVIYVQMMSVPGAFHGFICCIACVTSCSVETPVAISRSSFGVGRGSAVMVTDYLYITSEKCLTHLLAWVSSVVTGLLSWSLTMLTLVWVCLQSCLVSN